MQGCVYTSDMDGYAKMCPSHGMDTTFAERLQEARKSAGMTQDDLAHVVNVKGMTISRYETGATKNPARATIEAIAKALRCDPGWLLTGDAPMDAEADAPPDYQGLTKFLDSSMGKTVTDDELTMLRSIRFVRPDRNATPEAYTGHLMVHRGTTK